MMVLRLYSISGVTGSTWSGCSLALCGVPVPPERFERFGVSQGCRSYQSIVEGLSSVSGMELDLLCVCQWGEVPGVGSPAADPGFCSGGDWLAHLDSLEQSNMRVVWMTGGEDQKLNY